MLEAMASPGHAGIKLLGLLAALAGAPIAIASCNSLTGVGAIEIGGAAGSGAASAGGTSHGGTGVGAGNPGGSGGGGAQGGTAGSGGGSGSCTGVTCSGHGSCAPGDAGQPTCVCQPGYHDVGLECVADESCSGITCGRCANCQVLDGSATCVCPDGFVLTGGNLSDCTPSPDPCAGIDCGADGYCVPEAHCAPLGACVPTCDCSNCPNCGPDNSDHRWDDWQEYCGAQPDQSPATMVCNKPCAGGEGCLPYNPGICWPMEGCFSL
jgi:hypothetical protein